MCAPYPAAGVRGGTFTSTGLPSSSNPYPIGKLRRLSPRPSSTTRPFSQRVTAPQKPVVASSSTIPRSRAISGTTFFACCCQPLARTSVA